MDELSRLKETEDKLLKSEHRYRIMFENNPLGVFRMDHEGTIQDCNDKFGELMGSNREELIGLNAKATSNPELRQVIRKALAGEVGIFEGEYTSITGNKTSFLRFVYNPVHSAGSSPSDIIATVEDVSARRRAEQETRASSERLKAIFSSIKDPILVHPYSNNGHGTFSEMNDIACTRYGYTREEFLQLSVKDIIKQDPAQKLLAAERLKKIMTRGHMVFETVHVTKSGEEFPVEVSVCTMDQLGEKAVLAVVRDITERQAAQQEKTRLESRLQQAQKMESVGRLAGGVAHDFNNMLSVILGYCDLAFAHVSPGQLLYRNFIEIRKAAKHSADLTHQLLAFARQQAITPKVLDLNVAISAMLEMLRRLIGEEIDLEWHTADKVWPIKMDPAQINQILANLCINAGDAITGNGRIGIRTENIVLDDTDCAKIVDSRPGEYVVLSISDNGHGIKKELLDHIFEPFFTTKGQGEGTGLGLATVYGIIKQNNGFISVTSRPGHGTTFRNYLPRFTGQDEVQTEASSASGTRRSGGKETILLVEDEKAILKMITIMLSQQGYTILSATTPEEAIGIARQSNRTIHLLMTDVIMPQMNGRKLARRLQEIFPDLRCLYMSGYSADVIAKQGIMDDEILFIQKPFSQDQLMETIGAIFDRG